LLDLYFTSVGQQKQQLLDIGYTGISVYGQQSDYPLFTRLYDTWSYYVCRKARP
jgi:hypothetical protein